MDSKAADTEREGVLASHVAAAAGPNSDDKSSQIFTVAEGRVDSKQAENERIEVPDDGDSEGDDADAEPEPSYDAAEDEEPDPYSDPNGVKARRRARLRRAHPEDGDSSDDSKRDPDLANACKEEGNRHYGSGSYDTASACYTEALCACPRGHEWDDKRAVYHGNRAACHIAQLHWEDALYDCDRALALKPEYPKALCRRAQCAEQLKLYEDALKDYEAWDKMDPSTSYRAASDIARVKAAMGARDEALKTEMLDKLKGVGNSVLGYFGLSMDNFKAVQDPATGSYSISFQQNPGGK